MTPDEPTWDDTGFDAGANDNSGFLSSESGSRKRVTPEEPPAAPPPPPRREQSRRGPLFWFLVLAGVVFVVAVVGGFFYWVTQPSVEEQAFMAPASETSAPTTAAEPSAPVDATHSTATDVDVVHDPEALELLYGSDSAAAQRGTIAEKSTEKKEPTSSTPAETEKPTSAPTTSPTPSIAKKSTPPPTPVAKPTPIAKPTPTPAPTKKAETTSAPKGTSALYVVQVFSSPSRADAEEWLQLLRTKNVSDGYVTEQHIKGELWYRVRFGSFTTRESAESAAIRMGFKEPWIARIR